MATFRIETEGEGEGMGLDLSKLTPAPWIHYHPSEFPEDIRFAWGPKPPAGGYLFRLTKSHEPELSGPAGGAHANPKDADAAFMCLARAAFDVMMRRGWGVVRLKMTDGSHKWAVVTDGGGPEQTLNALASRVSLSDDPFTALRTADQWYEENARAVRRRDPATDEG